VRLANSCLARGRRTRARSGAQSAPLRRPPISRRHPTETAIPTGVTAGAAPHPSRSRRFRGETSSPVKPTLPSVPKTSRAPWCSVRPTPSISSAGCPLAIRSRKTVAELVRTPRRARAPRCVSGAHARRSSVNCSRRRGGVCGSRPRGALRYIATNIGSSRKRSLSPRTPPSGGHRPVRRRLSVLVDRAPDGDPLARWRLQRACVRAVEDEPRGRLYELPAEMGRRRPSPPKSWSPAARDRLACAVRRRLAGISRRSFADPFLRPVSNGGPRCHGEGHRAEAVLGGCRADSRGEPLRLAADLPGGRLSSAHVELYLARGAERPPSR